MNFQTYNRRILVSSLHVYARESLSESTFSILTKVYNHIEYHISELPSSSHLAVRSGLGSVVAAVAGLWRDSWRKAEWRSGYRRCWNLDGSTGESTSTSGSHNDIIGRGRLHKVIVFLYDAINQVHFAKKIL